MRYRKIFVALLAGTTALVPTAALASPGAIAALIVPFLSTAGIVGAIGFTGVATLALGIGYAVTAAALYGLSAAVTPGPPKVPKPADGKYNLKQPVPSLSYCLGRNKKGGDYVFLEEKNGTAYHITVLAGHRIEGIISHWLHDEEATLNGSGVVTAPSHFRQLVKILSRNGLDAETAYADVVTRFSEIWTDDDRGDGLASVRMSCGSIKAKHFQDAYPQQMPLHTAIFDGAWLYDPREESHDPDDHNTWTYSTNLALMRLWHLTHPVGGKLSMDDMYLPEWKHAADICDQDVTNRGGDTENRYHGGFWFRAENDPVEIGKLMDQAAELVVYDRADGKVGVHAGEYVAPTIRLTENDIIALSFDANRRRSTNVLAVRGRYTSPEDNFVTKDAAIYGNPYISDDSSQLTRTVDNQAVQSHNHMARLEKLTYIRANAPRVKVVAHYDAAKNVPYSRFVTVHMLPRLDEASIELTGRPKISLANLTVSFEGIVVPSALYGFNAATEEGVPGGNVVPVIPTGVPVPTGFAVEIKTEVIAGGATAAYALATWTFVSDALSYELEWEPTAGGDVQSAISGDENSVRSLYLADGTEYKFRLRTWSGGASSDWTEYQTLTATADPVAPGKVTGATLTGGVAQVTFDWTAPNSSNYFASRLYLNTTDDPATATLAATEYGAPGAADSRIVTGLTAGAYYGWIVAINASGTAADPVATGSATVT